MAESRTELVAWVNSVCGTEYQKVEQCGTGAAYCLILDSIYGNIPVTRVKINAKQEYEYIDNYKILQNGFKKNAIDKPLPVDRLIKCKMQDNLEFLQWYKKFWDQNYHGDGIYSAAGSVASGSHQAPAPRARPAPAAAPRTSRPATTTARTTSAARNVSAASVPRAQFEQVQGQLAELTQHCESLEKERDFYFDKLRNIEVIVQARLAVEGDAVGEEERDVLAKCQEILYSTVEGFEVPDPNEDPDSLANGEWPAEGEHEDDEETF